MKIKMTILLKMFLVVMSLICCTVLYISQSTYSLFEEVLMNREEYSNLNNSLLKSKEMEMYFETLMKKTKAYSKDVSQGMDIEDKEIVKIVFVGKNKTLHSQNKKWMAENNLSEKRLEEVSKRFLAIKSIGVYSLNERDFPPMGVFVFPVSKNGENMAIVSFDLSFLQKKMNSDKNVNYITNFNGDVVVHSEDSSVSSKKIDNIMVKEAVSSNKTQMQTRYQNSEDDVVVGAYYKSKNYRVIAFTEIPEKVILEPVEQARIEALYIAGIMLSLSFFIIYVLSISLTSPIKKLSELFKKVSTGDLSVSSNGDIKTLIEDETTDLVNGFDKMMIGLKEGDKVKNLMNKFQGQAITKDLLEKEIKFGGEKKEVVVFFSDIRGFTSYTENNEAEEVVSMLNDYFKVMVGIILNRKGIVDKFIGDAIMAAWGVPTAQKSSAKNAVMACLEMRKALMHFNKKRISQGKEPVVIGMGLHKGQVISGVVGSEEKMEYTIIGDTVNQAARIEEGTKAFGTDLLISQEIYEEIKDSFVIEVAGNVEAKGKAKPLTLYKVLGYVKEDGKDKIIETPYSSYEAKEGGKVKKTA